MYLYQNQYYWDSEKKQTRHIRRCVGKIDSETRQPLYNHRYQSEQKTQHTVQEAKVASIHPYGRTLLLEKVFVHSKLRVHLTKVFSAEEVASIKSLVFYLVCENNNLSYAPHWLRENYRQERPLSYEKIKDLLKILNKNRQGHFFDIWGKGTSKSEYYVYDLASKASYKSHNPYLYYGDNRQTEALEENNIVCVMDKKSMRPCNYTVLGGNMRDIPTFEILPFRTGLSSLESATLVLNMIFYSQDRIRLLLEQKQRFLLRVPAQRRWLATLIDAHREEILQAPSFQTEQEITLQAFTVKQEEGALVHIYFERSWREEQKRNLSNLLFACERELLENNLVDEHQRIYDEYFKERYSPKGFRKVVYRKDPQEVFKKSHAGYWALVTNCEDDPKQAIQTYFTRNHLEAEWENMKSEEDCRLLEVHDPYIFSGRAFLQFLSLVMTSYMDKVLSEHGGGPYKEALATMAEYSKVSYENLMHETRSSPTEEQKEIAKIFNLKL